MAEKAVASTVQYIYKRNFNENRWQDVGNGICKIQVKKKGPNYTLYIRPQAAAEEPLKLPLSKEQKLHLSNGFVQIPLADNRELYGIKFNDMATAEEFYGKVRDHMGLPWVDDKVGLGQDNMPKPFATFNPAKPQPFGQAGAGRAHPQSLPDDSPRLSRRQGGSDYGNDLRNQQPPLRAGGQVLRAGGGGGGGGGGGEMGGVLRAGGGGVVGDGPVRRAGGDGTDGQMFNAGGGEMGRALRAGGEGMHGQVGGGEGGRVHRAGEEGLYGAGGQGGGQFGGGRQQQEVGHFGQFGGDRRMSDGREFERRNTGGGRPADQVTYAELSHDEPRYGVGGSGGGARPPSAGGAGQQGFVPGGARQQGFPPGGVGQQGFPPGGVGQQGFPPGGVGQQGFPPGGVGQQGFVPLRAGSVENPGVMPAQGVKRAWSDRKPAAPARDPLPVNPEQIPEVVENLMGAINKRKKADAVKYLQALLASDADAGTVDMKVNMKPPEPKIKEFMLKLHVEFQQPRPPLKMYLDAHESDTIDLLQTKVQVKFFIPKASQNWIIGDKLIMGKEDLGKVLKDFQITSELDGAPIYVYVMHTKKADVSKEDHEAIRKRQMEQKKLQQQELEEGIYNVIQHPGLNYSPQQQQQQQQPQQQQQQRPIPVPRNQNYPGGRSQMEGGRGQRVDVKEAWVHEGRNEMDDGNLLEILNIPPMLRVNAAQPQAPPPEKKKEGWTCPACTFCNNPQRPGCEICGEERPADYEVPDGEGDDEATRQAMENERLFLEFTRAEREREQREAQENYRKYLEADDAAVVENDAEFDCPICYVPIPPGEGILLRGCLHQFCKECLNGTVVNSPDPEVKCPFADGDYECGAIIAEREIKAVVTPEELDALHRKGLMQAESASANSFHCRTANCQAFCYYDDRVNEFNCPVCEKTNCLLCKAIHEGMNCQEYQDDLKRRAANDEAARETQKMLDDMVAQGEAMHCPQCQVIVQKKLGCDWIRCTMCKTEICWATKQRRWGPGGKGDISGGCRCRVNKKKCHPNCRNCH